METRVTYRASEETVKRLQELAEKYGVSQSALLSLLVNDRWLAEQGTFGGGTPKGGRSLNVPDEDPNSKLQQAEEEELLKKFPALEGMQMNFPQKKKRKRKR